MNKIIMQVLLNPNPLVGLGWKPFTAAISLPRIGLGKTEAAPNSSLEQLTGARGGRIMRHGNLVEAHTMTALGNVPCNGCRACCLHDMIPLMPEHGDLIWTYEHEVIATATGPTAVLQCAKTGECIYLGQDGCTIHDRAPAICRAFDCRDLFLSKTRPERLAMVKSGLVSNEVFSAGRKRFKTLDLPRRRPASEPL